MEIQPSLDTSEKTSDANVLEVANSANAIFEQAKQRLPTGTQIQVMESGAVFIEGTWINNLTNTALPVVHSSL